MREPYDPLLIRKALEPERLAAGCGASVFSDADLAVCGRPPVAVRRWGSGEADRLLDDAIDSKGDLYSPVCKLHARRDVVPVTEVLNALRGWVGYHRRFDVGDLEACLLAAMFDWMIHTQPDLFPVEITGWEETPGTVRIFALSIYGSACEAMYEGTLDGFIRERISQRKGEPRL